MNERLKIGNKEDIKKVIQYELERGYNRLNPNVVFVSEEEEEYNEDYTVVLCVPITGVVRAEIDVEAKSSEEAKKRALKIVTQDDFELDEMSDIDIDMTNVTVEDIL